MRSGAARQAPWWEPAAHADRAPFLRGRVAIRRAVRNFFEGQGFTEVETALLGASPCAETHLHGFRTELVSGEGAVERWLPTSPEFACKKLLAAGETRIFELARAFRNRESGPTHAAEFTMLEWYRAGAPYAEVIADTVAVIRAGAAAVGATVLRHRGRAADPFAEPVRRTLAEAFAGVGIDLLASLRADGSTEREEFALEARDAGVVVAESDTWSDIFTRVMAELIEPHLDPQRLTVLYEYPAPEAALARRAPHDARVAERFEVYACGVELANGFGELTDAAEQRARYIAAMDEKARIYGERYPIDEDFLKALEIMPEASGVALGFDRLVMLATGADRIGQVVWTPAVDWENGYNCPSAAG
ncbi:MAG: EF-P lysine aminoacylase GenX [Alphaproteobacteria bacterium]|nr:EF-P lysine aminoacylase GenX [Alphaproteobacteria bacterium]